MRKIKIIAILIAILTAIYFFMAYSDIKIIKNLRTMYIETAMSTMTHQWLATAFLPKNVIDETMEEAERKFDINMVIASEIIPENRFIKYFERENNDFFSIYHEINQATIPITFDTNASQQLSDIEALGIKTKQGDSVWAIDTIHKILIVKIKDGSYEGKLAIIKDSANVSLAVSENKSRGETVTELCAKNDAVLGVNAGAFMDSGGHGNGKACIGAIVSNGKIISDAGVAAPYQIAGFDYMNNFRLGYGLDITQLRDAVEFFPIIVLNGQKVTTGSYGLGIQPRTCIGQTTKKETLMLVIDGRQVGHSLGTTVSECADILMRYDCYNAMNMDGGSSSSMTYMGKMITKTSSPVKTGRYLPNAWIVKNAK